MSQLALRKDVTPGLPGLFGGFTDFIDWVALLALPLLFFFGARNVRCAPMELPDWRGIDRIALFFGRITMIMIISMTSVMLYEVFLRYVVEAPTLWANELTLWIAGYVFLCSGLYAMQQRSHIRIFILYELVPRWLQKHLIQFQWRCCVYSPFSLSLAAMRKCSSSNFTNGKCLELLSIRLSLRQCNL